MTVPGIGAPTWPALLLSALAFTATAPPDCFAALSSTRAMRSTPLKSNHTCREESPRSIRSERRAAMALCRG
eukprot:1908478-Rhodomonas_salina.3